MNNKLINDRSYLIILKIYFWRQQQQQHDGESPAIPETIAKHLLMCDFQFVMPLLLWIWGECRRKKKLRLIYYKHRSVVMMALLSWINTSIVFFLALLQIPKHCSVFARNHFFAMWHNDRRHRPASRHTIFKRAIIFLASPEVFPWLELAL